MNRRTLLFKQSKVKIISIVLIIMLVLSQLVLASFNFSASPFNVQNQANNSLQLAASKGVDIALATGPTNMPYQSDRFDFEGDLKTMLSTGMDIGGVNYAGIPKNNLNISTYAGSTVGSQEKFDWWVYDHDTKGSVNDADPTVNAFNNAKNEYIFGTSGQGQTSDAHGANYRDRHIIEEADGSLDFWGYRAAAYKDMKYLPSNAPTKKTFEFTLTEKAAADALDGFGFFFNTVIDDGAGNPTDDVTKQKISGNLILNDYSGVIGTETFLYEFDNIDVVAFTSGSLFANMPTTLTTGGPWVSAGTGKYRVLGKTAFGNFKYRRMKIEAYPNTFTMWSESKATGLPSEFTDNSAKAVWTMADGTTTTTPKIQATGEYGYGVMSSYGAHSCERKTNFTLNDLVMKSDQAVDVSEVIREPKWKDKSNKYIINLNELPINDFDKGSVFGELMSRFGNGNIDYIGWGNNSNETQTIDFIKAFGPKAEDYPSGIVPAEDLPGTFVNMEDYNKAGDTAWCYTEAQYMQQVKKIAEYIMIQSAPRVVSDDYIIQGETINFALAEGSDMKLENATDLSYRDGMWKIKYSQEDFNNISGVYANHDKFMPDLLLASDMPGKYEIYYKTELVRTIIVHRAPVALFSLKYDKISGVVDYFDSSFDLDEIVVAGTIIKTAKWEYKDITDPAATNEWVAGQLTEVGEEKIYSVRLTVEDGFGAWSAPFTIMLNRMTGGDTGVIEKPVPIADFDISLTEIISGDTTTKLSIFDKSYDPAGTICTSIYTLRNSNGGIVDLPIRVGDNDFSSLPAGIYTITLVATASGQVSEATSKTFTVITDTEAPTVTSNQKDNIIFNQPSQITLTFNDAGASGFRDQSYYWSKEAFLDQNSDEWSVASTSKIRTVTLQSGGTWYLHTRGFDKANNVIHKTFGAYTLTQQVPTVEYDITNPVNGDTVRTASYNDELDLTVTLTFPDGMAAPTNGLISFYNDYTNQTINGLSGVFQIPHDNTSKVITFTTTWNASCSPKEGQNIRIVFDSQGDVNFGSVDKGIVLVVDKLVPIITSIPTASEISYPSLLSDSTLEGGVATIDGVEVAGTFVWATPKVKPGVGQAQHTYTVQFVPNDKTNYEIITLPAPVMLSVFKGEQIIGHNNKMFSQTYTYNGQAKMVDAVLEQGDSNLIYRTPSGGQLGNLINANEIGIQILVIAEETDNYKRKEQMFTLIIARKEVDLVFAGSGGVGSGTGQYTIDDSEGGAFRYNTFSGGVTISASIGNFLTGESGTVKLFGNTANSTGAFIATAISVSNPNYCLPSNESARNKKFILGSGVYTGTPNPKPSAVIVGVNSITLAGIVTDINATEGLEYSMNGTTYQKSPTFNGLTQGTTYTFYIRHAATGTGYQASQAIKMTYRTLGQFTVTFKNADGTILFTYSSVTENAIATAVGYTVTGTDGKDIYTTFESHNIPIKEGYDFASWQIMSNGVWSDFTNSVLITADLVVQPRYTAQKYTVDFIEAGGINLPVGVVTFDSAYKWTVSVKPGYTFLGWFSEPNGAGVQYTDGTGNSIANWTIETDKEVGVTAFANWSVNDYTVSFEDYTINSDIAQVTVTYDAKFTFEVPVKTGYTFGGWYTGVNGTGIAFTDELGNSTGDSVWAISNDDATAYAKWTANNYTVTFEDYSEDVITKSFIATFDAGYNWTIPTKTGYTFGGWFSEMNGTGTPFTGANGVSFNNWTTTEDKVVYAKWTANEYTVTFSDDTTDVSTVDMKNEFDASYAWSIPTKTGYTFGGWFTEPKGKGTAFTTADGKSIANWTIANNETTAYAKWTANKYIITFEDNTNDVITNTSEVTFNAGYSWTVPTKTGYTFGGWYDSDSFSNALTAENGQSYLSWAVASDTTVYAKWTANEYIVTFDGYTGEAVTATQTYDAAYNWNVPTKTGYTFGGWFSEADGAGTPFTTAVGKSIANWTIANNDTTAYAKWTANSYTASFVDNSEIDNDATANSTFDSAYTWSVPVKTGYTFLGWFATADFADGTAFTNADGTSIANWTIANNDTTAYAKWSANEYTITLVDDSDDSGLDKINSTFDSAYTWDVPVKTGYTFLGWFTKANGAGTAFTTANGKSIATWTIANNDTIAYASWSANNYTVTFNGYSDDAATAIQTFDAAYTWSVPVKTGYTFGGWFSEANGEGTAFTNADGSSIANWTIANDDAIAFAKWTANGYNINLVDYSDDCEVVSAVLTFDAEYNIVVPTKTGYTFLGWFTGENGTGTPFTTADGKSVSNWVISDNETIAYASWTANNYTVTFEDFTDETASDDVFVVFGTSFNFEVPTRLGYIFLGWANGTDADSDLVTDNLGNGLADAWMTATDTQLFAKWQIIEFNINFVYNNNSDNSSEVVDFDTKLTKPSDPAFTDYKFVGWFTDKACTQLYDFDYRIRHDVELFAKWNAISVSDDSGQIMISNSDAFADGTKISLSESTTSIVGEIKKSIIDRANEISNMQNTLFKTYDFNIVYAIEPVYNAKFGMNAQSVATIAFDVKIKAPAEVLENHIKYQIYTINAAGEMKACSFKIEGEYIAFVSDEFKQIIITELSNPINLALVISLSVLGGILLLGAAGFLVRIRSIKRTEAKVYGEDVVDSEIDEY